MATEPTPQRAYRSTCPNCGAPVDFRSAASAFAVCSFCRSTLVRDGAALRRIGESAELFDDHSPLALGAAGKYQGLAFTLVGRVQVRYAQGSWNEWHALFDGGRGGWLSEDNGQYVFGFDAPLGDEPVPAIETLRPGAPLRLAGQAWTVGSVVRARLAAAEGELPFAPDLGREHLVADLRNTRGEVGSLEQAPGAPPRWSIGRAVALADLALTGLSEAGAKTLSSRGVSCPSCGAALEPKLETTRSIVCPQCKAVVDVSQGVGGDLAYFRQSNPGVDGGEPQIPLGSTGTLALGSPPVPWQVVGYAERCEVPDEPDGERSYWREYLLYHRVEGFAFLVDAEDGWSWARPIPGVPERVGEQVRLDGVQYRPLYTYTGIATYVLGEFYWQLRRDDRTRNTDYQGTGANARKRLNREASGDEVIWSRGETLDADAVAAAFRLPQERRAALQRDAAPIGSAGSGLGKGLLIFILLVVVIIVLAQCGDDDCDDLRRTFGEASGEYRQCVRSGGSSYRSGGGSFGGFSTGGGHK